jgi:hypothetical protein
VNHPFWLSLSQSRSDLKKRKKGRNNSAMTVSKTIISLLSADSQLVGIIVTNG